MKKCLMIIPYFFLWLMYFFFTLEERNRYMLAKDKNMDCVNSHFDGFYIFGTVDKYYFDQNKKPVRRYLTWKEFWNARGYA